MKNIMYVVANASEQTILVVTPDRNVAYRTAMTAQQLGASEEDISITPMNINQQYGKGTDMCYDEDELQETLDMIDEWDNEEDEEYSYWDDRPEDEEEEEDYYPDDEDEDEDEDTFSAQDLWSLIFNQILG